MLCVCGLLSVLAVGSKEGDSVRAKVELVLELMYEFVVRYGIVCLG